MATTITDTTSAYLEVVRPMLEKLFEQSDQIAGRVKKSSQVQKISRYFFRVPLKLYSGGNFKKTGIDGASLGVGNGPKYTHLKGGYFSHSMGFRITTEQEETSSSEQTVINVLSDILGNAMKEMAVMDDIIFHQDGSGVLTAASSGSSATSLTFAGATDYLGVNLLREGMCVDVWDTALTTKRVAATAKPIKIIAIDRDAKTVTFDQTVTAIATTDKITFQDIASADSYGATTPLSYQSTYPVSGTGGVGGDSFCHGFPYMTDHTTSNYFYSLLKSTVPQIQAVRVNANSNPFEWDFIHRMIAKITAKRDEDSWKGLFGITNVAQRAQIAALGVGISFFLPGGDKFGKTKDMIPDNMGYADTVDVGGMPHVMSKRQDRSRIDYINPAKIYRAQLFDTKYADNGSGGYIHVGRNSSGEVCTYKEFFIQQAYDYVCVDAGAFGKIDGLTLPTAWDA